MPLNDAQMRSLVELMETTVLSIHYFEIQSQAARLEGNQSRCDSMVRNAAILKDALAKTRTAFIVELWQ